MVGSVHTHAAPLNTHTQTNTPWNHAQPEPITLLHRHTLLCISSDSSTETHTPWGNGRHALVSKQTHTHCSRLSAVLSQISPLSLSRPVSSPPQCVSCLSSLTLSVCRCHGPCVRSSWPRLKRHKSRPHAPWTLASCHRAVSQRRLSDVGLLSTHRQGHTPTHLLHSSHTFTKV